MKRVLSLFLLAAILLTAIPWSVPIQAEAAGNPRYTVLVLDISGSKRFTQNGSHLYTAETAIEYVKDSAVTFLQDMAAASDNNHVAVVTYASSASIVSDFTQNMTSLSRKISDIDEPYDNNSNITDGLETAHSLINSIADENAIKNVILFTTGMCNEGNSDLYGHYDSYTIGSDWYRTDTGIKLYAYSNVAYKAAEALKEDATIYTLGVFQTMEDMPEAGREIADFFIMLTRDLASDESCFYNVADPSELEFAFGEIADNITASPYTFKYPGMINASDTESVCYYTDSYFLKSADIYNASLATMSLCLELSCWSSYDKASWYNSNLTPNDDAFWEDRLVNAKKLLLGDPDVEGDVGLGFSNFSANADWEKDPKMNSIGVCLAQKTITDRMGNDCTLVAIVVRGGGYGSEWGGNFYIGSEKEHEGFKIARDKVLEFTKDYISNLDPSEKQNMKLWIVGYSRGGATANMVAGALNDNCQKQIGVNIDSDNIYCYTFEAPQGVLTSQISGSDANIHNVLNTNDLVPQVAPSAWNFTRYTCDCQGNHYFPSRYTTDPASFTIAKSAMQTQLEEMGFDDDTMEAKGNKFRYNIQEFSTVPTIHIDLSKFLPGGKPLYWTEESIVPTYEVLSNAVDFLSTDVFFSRNFYYENAQDCLTSLISEIMHYDSSIGNAKLAELKEMLSEVLSEDNIIYILTPILIPNPLYSNTARTLDMQQRLDKVLKEAFRDLEDSESLISAIEVILTKILFQVSAEIATNNTDSINLVLQAWEVFNSTGFQPHYPEVTLAWCRSLDPNYNSALTDVNYGTNTRIVRINCPVNVQVYDESGILVAQIIDGVPAEDNQLICYVNSEGEKVFYLPGNGRFTVDIAATDEGTVSYSVSDYDFAHSAVVAAQNYYDIPIEEGDALQAYVNTAPSAGSTPEYTLWHNGNLCEADEILTADEAAQNTIITVQTEGTGGYAEGTGSYAHGSFAQVEASTLPGGKFLGWYDITGKLLTEELIYRFAARENMVLIAKFSDVSFHDLKLTAEEGGTIQGQAGTYCEGMEISLIATPAEGYKFAGWEVSDGEMDCNDPEAVFTMPDKKATVTALFEPINKESDTTAEEDYTKQIIMTIGVILFSGIVLIQAGLLVASFKKRDHEES